MKKKYNRPFVLPVTIGAVSVICSSNEVSSEGDVTIGYGGVDTGGKKDPSSRRDGVWGDEESEDEDRLGL